LIIKVYKKKDKVYLLRKQAYYISRQPELAPIFQISVFIKSPENSTGWLRKYRPKKEIMKTHQDLFHHEMIKGIYLDSVTHHPKTTVFITHYLRIAGKESVNRFGIILLTCFDTMKGQVCLRYI
jgi:hypothetical protein